MIQETTEEPLVIVWKDSPWALANIDLNVINRLKQNQGIGATFVTKVDTFEQVCVCIVLSEYYVLGLSDISILRVTDFMKETNQIYRDIIHSLYQKSILRGKHILNT